MALNGFVREDKTDFGEVWENIQRPPSLSQLVDETVSWKAFPERDGCKGVASRPVKRGRQEGNMGHMQPSFAGVPAFPCSFYHGRCQVLPPGQPEVAQRGFSNKRICLKGAQALNLERYKYGLSSIEGPESNVQPDFQQQKRCTSDRARQNQVMKAQSKQFCHQGRMCFLIIFSLWSIEALSALRFTRQKRLAAL